jgi:hypothetical protein
MRVSFCRVPVTARVSTDGTRNLMLPETALDAIALQPAATVNVSTPLLVPFESVP